MADPEAIFRSFLHARRLKLTDERAAILRAAPRFNRPFEAEELLIMLRELNERVSKATVYRTLKHLVDAQLLKQVVFGANKQSHYEWAADGRGHDHLVDMDSGKIVPFNNTEIIRLRDEIARSMGFSAVSHRFQIIGRRNAKP